MERCALLEDVERWYLEGTVLTLLRGDPTEIRYALACDEAWRTQSCSVDIEGTVASESFEFEVDEGVWTVNGRHERAFDGLTDIDLGFSPCTNTLPIRRLALEVGQSARIAVVWLRFPSLEIVRSEQVYTRLADHTYRYDSGSGDFTAELDVDELGIVTRYGDFWRELRPA
jgi:hypothetical protein